MAGAPSRRRAAGGALERPLRRDGHLLPGHRGAAGAGNLPRQLRPGRDDPWPAGRSGAPGDRAADRCPAPGARARSARVLPARCGSAGGREGEAGRRRRSSGPADRLLGGQWRRHLSGPRRAGSGVRVLDLPAARAMTGHRPAGGRHAAAPGKPGRRIASSPMGKLPLRARLATTIGGAAGRMSRLAGRGDGSVIGGVIGLRVEPDLLALLAAGRRVVLVTGTNGKTTTTRLITGVLGQEIASNAFGANMEAGLTAALGQAPDAPLAVLEVDEKYLPTVLAATRARAVALLNLSRDQMDRAAEIWLVARRWREALASAPNCTVIANADDPLIAWAAAAAPDVIWVAAGQCWHEDSWCCPQCGSHLSR